MLGYLYLFLCLFAGPVVLLGLAGVGIWVPWLFNILHRTCCSEEAGSGRRRVKAAAVISIFVICTIEVRAVFKTKHRADQQMRSQPHRRTGGGGVAAPVSVGTRAAGRPEVALTTIVPGAAPGAVTRRVPATRPKMSKEEALQAWATPQRTALDCAR